MLLDPVAGVYIAFGVGCKALVSSYPAVLGIVYAIIESGTDMRYMVVPGTVGGVHERAGVPARCAGELSAYAR